MKSIIIMLISTLLFRVQAESSSLDKNVVADVLTLNRIASTTGEANSPNCQPSPSPTPSKHKWATVYDWKGRVINVNIVSPERALELFNKMKNQTHIPFEYKVDGCYAKAHEMSLLLEKEGIITGKAFIEGHLKVDIKPDPVNFYGWRYHVAPFIVVNEKKDLYKIYIIDPTIFDKPVTVEQWSDIQTRHAEGRKDKLYFTNRFYYNPSSLNDEYRENYKQANINDAKDVLQKFLELQNKLKGN